MTDPNPSNAADAASDNHAEAPMTRDEILRLPASERAVWVEAMRVFYPRWETIHDEIRRCHRMNVMAAEAQCLLLVGPTGAGKTTLTRSYAEHFPADYSSKTPHIPVLEATILAPATVKTLVTTLLHALGDPRAGMGTIGGMTYRLMGYMQDCGVELLILDELQHFMDRDSLKVLQVVSDWLKTVIKETKIATILVGLENRAEIVVETDAQLARLFGDQVVLAPFAWDEADPATAREFRDVIANIEAGLPLREPSHLASPELAWRCFVASDGLISHLMAVIRRAAHLALEQNQEHIDQALLARAFQQRSAGVRRRLENPFLGDLPHYTPLEERMKRSGAQGAAHSTRPPRKRRTSE